MKKLTDRWSTVLAQLRRQGRYRELSLPGGIDFTSNDYLGYGGTRVPPVSPELPRSGSDS